MIFHVQILLQHYCHDQILLTPFSFYNSLPSGRENKVRLQHSITYTSAFHLSSLFTSSPLAFLPQCALWLSKFCYFQVTELIIFVLFKAPLRNQVKLAPLEQALLFKSPRCSNVLAIFSHSSPMGHLGEAPVTVPAKSRKCSMTPEPKGSGHSQCLIPRAVRKP